MKMNKFFATQIKKQAGQIILILVLVMTAALAVGLAAVQRSLTDVSTSTKVDQSSRAFSAAEAGIERALKTNSEVTNQSLGNDSLIKQVDVNQVPTGNRPYEPSPDGLKKEDFAQVWLANPETLAKHYDASDLNIYWGNEGATTGIIPAVEVNIIYQSAEAGIPYKNKPFFYDSDSDRRSNNHFDDPLNPPSSGSCPSAVIITDVSPSSGKRFYCRRTIDLSSLPGGVTKLIMVRARLLYNDQPQGFAVGPTVGALPPQGRLFISTGASGDVTRTVRVLNTDKVLPVFFDYAIFSLGDIRK